MTEGEPQPLKPRQGADPEPHTVEVVHRGAFAVATCQTCPWRGPGRRAVGRAVVDGDQHARTSRTDSEPTPTWTDEPILGE